MTTGDRHRADELARRERANQQRGEVVEGSGEIVTPRRLDQMISLRLEPDLVVALRDLAEQRGISVSELLRLGAQLVLREAAETPSAGVVVFDRVVGGTFAFDAAQLAASRNASQGVEVEYPPAVSG